MATPKSKSFTIDLKIPDVTTLLKERMRSETLVEQFLCWSLRAQMDKGANGDEFLSVSLHCDAFRCSEWVWKCKATFQIMLKDKNGRYRNPDFFQDSASKVFSNQEQHHWFTNWYSYSKLINPTNDLLVDGGIHIFMVVTAENPEGLHFNDKLKLMSIFGYSDAAATSGTVEHLLTSGEGANVVIVTRDGTEFKGHKGILGRKSPVLANMFQRDMEEGVTGRVVLIDMNDQLSLLEVKELINAAEKYGFPELKQYCGYLLVERCSVKEVVDLYKFAKRFGLEENTKEIFKFAQEHLLSFWDELIDNVKLAEKESNETEEMD